MLSMLAGVSVQGPHLAPLVTFLPPLSLGVLTSMKALQAARRLSSALGPQAGTLARALVGAGGKQLGAQPAGRGVCTTAAAAQASGWAVVGSCCSERRSGAPPASRGPGQPAGSHQLAGFGEQQPPCSIGSAPAPWTALGFLAHLTLQVAGPLCKLPSAR